MRCIGHGLQAAAPTIFQMRIILGPPSQLAVKGRLPEDEATFALCIVGILETNSYLSPTFVTAIRAKIQSGIQQPISTPHLSMAEHNQK